RSGTDGSLMLATVVAGADGSCAAQDTPPFEGGYTCRVVRAAQAAPGPLGQVSVSVSAALPLPPPVPTPPPLGSRQVQLDGYWAVVVDDRHQHLLVSTDDGNSVEALSLGGDIVARIPAL